MRTGSGMKYNKMMKLNSNLLLLSPIDRSLTIVEHLQKLLHRLLCCKLYINQHKMQAQAEANGPQLGAQTFR
jgi:hypothetical protein